MRKKKPVFRPVETEEFIQRTNDWLDGLKRPAWIPIVSDGDSGVTASKFSGVPWLADDEEWPTCGECNNSLHLLLQLNLDNLPKELGENFGSGLLQFFFCTRDDCLPSGFGSECSPTALLRIVQPVEKKLGTTVPRFNDDNPRAFSAKTIRGWRKQDDRPTNKEYEESAVNVTNWFDRGIDQWLQVTHAPLAIKGDVAYDDFKQLHDCYEGDKLAGWPCWVQGRAYPRCSICDQPMRTHLFTITFGNNLSYSPGDGDKCYIFQCSNHKNVLAFPSQSG